MSFLNSIIKTVLVLTAFVWVSGCVSTSSTPGFARNGDVVVLGLGGIHRNSGSADVLKAEDLTVTVTDSANNTYGVPVLRIFRAYPEYASALNENAMSGAFAGSGIVSYDGAWYAVVGLIDNTDPSSPTQMAALADGPATFSVTSEKLTNTTFFGEGDLTAMPIEILPEPPGYVYAFNYNFNNQFNQYRQSQNNFLVAPDNLAGVTDVAGAYLVITYDDDTLFDLGLDPVVVPVNHNPYVQLSYNVVPDSSGNGGKIYITILNPAGFSDSGAANASLLADLGVKVLYFPADTSTEDLAYINSFAVDLAESYYIDMAGDEIATVDPLMRHFSAL